MRAMKDSGVEWIGEIPEGWNVIKIKHYSDSQVGYSFKSEMFSEGTNGVKLVRGDNITEGKLRWGEKARYWSEVSYELEKYLLKAGDIVISMDGSKVGKNYAMIDEFELPLLLVQRVTRLRALDPLDQRFLFYFFKDGRFRSHVDAVKTDPAIPHITLKNIIDYEITLPPITEQTRIASFLDTKCATIDAAIENQRATIDTLKEYRQAVITEAVTKGLHPDVPMKDSGVEWIGEIPEGWDVCKIKWLARMKSGDNITSLNIDDESPYPVYGGNGLRGYTKSFTHNGSFILIGRQGALCGNVHIVNGEFWASEHAIVTYELITLDQKWLFYILSAMNLNQYSTSAAQPGLSVDQIQKLSTFLPPISEQTEIAACLDQKCTAIDSAVSKKETLIDKLTEYKKSLIYEAVTGKTEVPEPCGAN